MPLSPAVRPYDHLLLDLDGTVWVGDSPVPGAIEAVAALREAGKAVLFLTNDVRLAPEAFVRKLWRLGFQASVGEVLSVGAALQFWLAEAEPRRTAYVVGAQALVDHVAEAGLRIVNGTTFHRIVKDFVIQGGDPAGTGEGGPGYAVVEAPPSDLTYDKGVVAMAKTQTDPAGASGSQFFVVTGDGAAQLPPDYALLGKVTSGMDTVDKINGVQADPNTGQPAFTVVIKSITVAEK